MPRGDELTTRNTFVCPFYERCNCPVKFRIFASQSLIKLETQGEHTPESHVLDKVTKFLSIPQAAAIDSVVTTNPMGNATAVRRGLELHPDPMVKVSPSKQRMVQRAVARARAKALLPFTMGEELKGDEGSLNRFSEQIFLKDLVDDHNSGAKHLELHQPVCLGYQYGNGVVYGNYSTPFLICNAMRGVNSEWPLHLGFDSTFGLSNKKFELLGITTNSLRRHANPVCLCIVKQECSTAYRNMYTSMEGAVFELAHNLKLCKKDCEMCDSVREQIEQGPMCDLLTPPKSKKGSKPKPLKFKLPLAKPMCDNTTKFSKFIDEMFPGLSNDILICAAHLTGIAWQKKSHGKYFDSQAIYAEWYKIVVRCIKCSSKALAIILQIKLVQWLRDHGEHRAAEWFQTYWTEKRGNYMLAHAGVGGTNTNCGTEGNWHGLKKEVCGTAGSTSGLAVRVVVPSLVRFLSNKSKEQASFWKKATKQRTNNYIYNFPSLPLPIRSDWVRLDNMHPKTLFLSVCFGSIDTCGAWRDAMVALFYAAKEAQSLDSPLYEHIKALHEAGSANLPSRRSISHIIFPSSKYIAAREEVEIGDLRAGMRDDLMKFNDMLENPAGHFENYPEDDAEAYIAVHESFYLLQPLGESWGKWTSWKCGCPDFFAAGCCAHSLVMTLLYNSAIEFPIKYSTQQLPSSGKTKRRPSAWAEHHVEPEVSRAERWAPRQLGMGDMLVVREPRVRTVLYILPPNSA